MSKKVIFEDLGLMDYQAAWDYQEKLFKKSVDLKIENRKKDLQQPITSYLLFCEHPHVFTLGKSGNKDNLLANTKQLEQKQATFYKINRGGDVTYHGPGQIVGYPILDLENFFTDIHKYLRFLEEVIILTLADYGIKAGRYEGYTGVWIDPDVLGRERKICAMGVRCSRWVTMHGFAFNVNTNLDYFNNIVPCGIQGKQVTSLEKELGKKVAIDEVKTRLKKHLSVLFEMQLIEENSEALL